MTTGSYTHVFRIPMKGWMTIKAYVTCNLTMAHITPIAGQDIILLSGHAPSRGEGLLGKLLTG